MLKSLSIPVTESNQVGEARRAAQRLAIQSGLDETLAGNLGIVVTEMGTNLHKHAKGGELLLRPLVAEGRTGVEVLSLDRGPGMREVAKCLEDGYSTAGTKGNGLGSIKRLSSVFDIYSTPQGTAVVAQIWSKSTAPGGPSLEVGAVCLPYPGEFLCGDAWSIASWGVSPAIFVADGLGHGKEAAAASDLAMTVFEENPGLPSELIMQKCHGALRSTRGAAVFSLRARFQDRKIVCSGIGNISAGAIKGAVSKSFVSLNGTIGHQAQRFQEFSYDWAPASLIFLHSDGLQSKWKLDAYPGLQARHPSLIAGILFRDFRRERDDVTILVARETTGSS